MTARRVVQRGALVALVVSTAAIAAAYASAFLPGGAPAWAAWAMALGTATCMAAITLLAVASSGAVVRGRGAPFAVVVVAVAAVWVLTSVCFALALVLPAEPAAAPILWLGLPRRAAILLYGIGFLPLFILPFAYALTFDALTLPAEELARIRAAAKAAQAAAARSQEAA
jgi:hypothetical protein